MDVLNGFNVITNESKVNVDLKGKNWTFFSGTLGHNGDNVWILMYASIVILTRHGRYRQRRVGDPLSK